MPDNFPWSPIADLPSDLSALSDGELQPLLAVWEDQRSALASDVEVAEFTRRLSREWAIETGIIEGLYTLDRGVTETLIERGIEASLIPHEATNRDREDLAAILHAHLDALEGLFSFVRQERPLTVGYIKDVHQALLRHQKTYTVRDPSGNICEKELSKGVYKTQPNNPTRTDGGVHEYCPPEHVAAEMDRMIEFHQRHAAAGVSPEVEAAWLHHAFSQIHPFSDGNGRVARLIASLLFLKARGFPMLITRDERTRYIDALEAADRGNLGALVSLFVQAQRRDVLRALQALPGVKQTALGEPATIEQEIEAARRLLVLANDQVPKYWEPTTAMVSTLFRIGMERAAQIRDTLDNEIGRYNREFAFSLVVTDAGVADIELFKWVHAAARHFGYEPNLRPIHSRYEFGLKTTNDHSRIVLSLHGIGPSYRGVAAGILMLVPSGQTPICSSESFFQVNYRDTQAGAKSRFKTWYEPALTRALALWRQRL